MPVPRELLLESCDEPESSLSATSSVMPRPSSATAISTSFPSFTTWTSIVRGPSSRMAWRTAFSTIGCTMKPGTMTFSHPGATDSLSRMRSSPKRAFSIVR